MDVIKGSAAARPIPTKETSSEKDSLATVAGVNDGYVASVIKEAKALKAAKEDLPLAVESGATEDDQVSYGIHTYGGASFAVDTGDASPTIVGGIDVDVFLARKGNYQFGTLTKIETVVFRRVSAFERFDEDSGKYTITEHVPGPDSEKVSIRRTDTSLRLGQAALVRMNFVDIPKFMMAFDSSLGVLLDVGLDGRDAGSVGVDLALDAKVVMGDGRGLELFVGFGERIFSQSAIIGEYNIIFGIGHRFI